jgi:hypothetical protein
VPDDDRDGAAQVGVPEVGRRVRRGRDEAHAALAQGAAQVVAIDGLDGPREDAPHAGPDDVGVEEVGAAARHEHRVDAGGVRAAQERAEVARLLQPVRHQVEAVGAPGSSSSPRTGAPPGPGRRLGAGAG